MAAPSPAPTYIDLFAGCGGASQGFHDAGFECLLAVDWDPKAIACYNSNFSQSEEHPVGVVADLSEITSREDVYRFLERQGIIQKHCDVIVGGPPCQSFSSVGRRKVASLKRVDEALKKKWEEMDRSRTMLFEAYAFFVEALAPRWILFENVPTIRSHETYPLIHERFNNLVRPDGQPLKYHLFPENHWASDYGVPQRRRRFIMVGFRNDLGIKEWRRPSRCDGPLVGDALGDLPSVPAGSRKLEVPYVGPPVTEYQKAMRRGRSDAEGVLRNHVCRSHNPDDLKLFGEMLPGARFSDEAVQEAIRAIPAHKLAKYSVDKFQDKLHKLDPERQSWTVTAHLQKDCYKFIHYRDPRTVTVREAARLQSFPDHFKLPDVMGVGFRCVGNAIPPLLAYAFANSFRASDHALGSYESRVRAVIPDHIWEPVQPLAELQFPRKPRGRVPIPIRTVLAAGLLRTRHHWSWKGASAYLGRTAQSIQKNVKKLQQGGFWTRALERFSPQADAAGQLELEIQRPEEVMAAD